MDQIKGKKKPDKPKDCTPDNPGHPGHPGHPQNQVSSTPYAGEPVNATNAPGQIANNVPAGIPAGSGTNIAPTTYADSFGQTVNVTVPTVTAPGVSAATTTG